jgi:hypothetical protein
MDLSQLFASSPGLFTRIDPSQSPLGQQQAASQWLGNALAAPITDTWQHASNIAQGRGDYGMELANLLLGVGGLAVPEARGGDAAKGALDALEAALFRSTPKAADNVFPIVSNELRDESRAHMDFPHITRVDADALRQAYEADQKEPLAWNPWRADNVRRIVDSGTPVNDYPRVGYYQGRVGVDDGRHRISVAADRGQLIDIAVGSPGEATALQDRLSRVR